MIYNYFIKLDAGVSVGSMFYILWYWNTFTLVFVIGVY